MGAGDAIGAGDEVVAVAAGAEDDLLAEEDLLAGRDSSAMEPSLNANKSTMPIKTAFMETPSGSTWIERGGPTYVRRKDDLP